MTVLEAQNVVSFRESVLQTEVEEMKNNMEMVIKQSGAKIIGNPITATYGIDGNRIDIELLLPIDKRISITDKFFYKEKIKITNAVVAKYKGNPNGLQNACNELNQYIIEHKLVPITVEYNVTRKVDSLNLDSLARK